MEEKKKKKQILIVTAATKSMSHKEKNAGVREVEEEREAW